PSRYQIGRGCCTSRQNSRLTASDAVFINMHAGITPKYRGVEISRRAWRILGALPWGRRGGVLYQERIDPGCTGQSAYGGRGRAALASTIIRRCCNIWLRAYGAESIETDRRCSPVALQLPAKLSVIISWDMTL